MMFCFDLMNKFKWWYGLGLREDYNKLFPNGLSPCLSFSDYISRAR